MTGAVFPAKAKASPLPRHVAQRGAALLLAMLTVTLVASFSAAALWQQWRSVEIEAAQRQRVQLNWVLTGALDWARLILQEDVRGNSVDYLSEPWSLPLQEARLSSFLAADKNATDSTLEAFLSGQMTDQQAKLNIASLVQEGKLVKGMVSALDRLFQQLKLPKSELDLLAEQWLLLERSAPALAPLPAPSTPAVAANSTASGNAAGVAPLRPQRLEQLVWLGLATETVKALEPYLTVLPERTAVNVNTAPAAVLYAVLPGVDMAMARQLVQQRATRHFNSVADVLTAATIPPEKIEPGLIDVASRYFIVRGRMRLEDAGVQEISLVERQGGTVRVLWRQRESIASLQSAGNP